MLHLFEHSANAGGHQKLPAVASGTGERMSKASMAAMRAPGFCVYPPLSRAVSRRKDLTSSSLAPRVAPFCLSSPPSTPAPPSASHAISHTSRPSRTATVSRTTRETAITLTLNVDGTGICDVETGIPFLDHMLAQLCSHGLFDLHLRAKGDLWIDDHHTNEDIAITLGMALSKALADKKGIRRFGHFVAPLDESLVEVVLDFSGRGHCQYSLDIPTQRVGTYDTQLVREFYHAVAGNAQMTLHVIQRTGINSHHIIEASFKSFARAMRMAVEYDPRSINTIPSSKGVLTDAAALESTPNA
ncbi:unnamed protein product [Agarophyton chilense]